MGTQDDTAEITKKEHFISLGIWEHGGIVVGTGEGLGIIEDWRVQVERRDCQAWPGHIGGDRVSEGK